MSGSIHRKNQSTIKETYYAVQIGDFETAWPYLMRGRGDTPELYLTPYTANRAADKLNAEKGNDAAKAIRVWIRSK